MVERAVVHRDVMSRGTSEAGLPGHKTRRKDDESERPETDGVLCVFGERREDALYQVAG